VSSRSVSSLGENLDGSDDLDGSLEVEVDGVEGFGLHEHNKRNETSISIIRRGGT